MNVERYQAGCDSSCRAIYTKNLDGLSSLANIQGNITKKLINNKYLKWRLLVWANPKVQRVKLRRLKNNDIVASDNSDRVV